MTGSTNPLTAGDQPGPLSSPVGTSLAVRRFFPEESHGLPGAFQPVLAWWKHLRGDRQMPYREDMRFRDLRGWHSSVLLSEVTECATDCTCRLAGEDVRTAFCGRIRPGTRYSSLDFLPDETRKDHIAALVEDGVLGHGVGQVTMGEGRTVPLDVLDLPLADKAGRAAFILAFFAFPLPIQLT
ncbi:PAS domain-containing protein [Yunchengibacter salinarum]|uniref:PAS domain-containing protein n=1 Tax=Yunchengibacter salinarum TaxID=3133399 RepID=UPI0035B5FCD7